MPLVLTAQIFIACPGPEPHPGGGFYRETYCNEERIQRGIPPVECAAAIAIYYLLADGVYSAWHRIQLDELWYFHAGDSLNVHVLEADDMMSTHRLGYAAEDTMAAYQAVVPAGRWLAAERVSGEHGCVFAGCAVASGFESSELELAGDSALLVKHPAHGDLIRRLLPRPVVR